MQNNVSFNAAAGVTRGVHAEPWDKLVSVATGRIFGAWVDLRPGESFGTVVTHELGPDTAVFVPRGVGNAFQTLEPGTAYSYLVNDHWSLAAKDSYTFVNLADETLAIDWPIPLDRAELSDADREHPRLADAVPMRPEPMLIIGAGGQLGRALARALPGCRRADPGRAGPRRPGLGRCLRLRAVRRGDQRGRPYRGRRGRDAGRSASGLGDQRDRRRRPGRGGSRAPLHAGPGLVGLRLRRDGRAARRERAVLTARRVRPDQGGRRCAGGRRSRGTTSSGPAG